MPILKVYFDESCGICKNVKKILTFISFNKKCEFLFADEMDFPPNSEEMLNRYYDLYSFDGTNFFKGYDTYCQIFKRNPLLFVFYLFMKLPFVKFIGEKIYRKVANSRTCKIQ